jgi:hypothetical protein
MSVRQTHALAVNDLDKRPPAQSWAAAFGDWKVSRDQQSRSRPRARVAPRIRLTRACQRQWPAIGGTGRPPAPFRRDAGRRAAVPCLALDSGDAQPPVICRIETMLQAGTTLAQQVPMPRIHAPGSQLVSRPARVTAGCPGRRWQRSSERVVHGRCR